MKAHITDKTFLQLSKSEQDRLLKIMNAECDKALEAQEIELQKVWLKLCCIILHEVYGFGESRLYQFLGNWKRIYKWNSKLENSKRQSEEINKKIDKIFRKNGYPDDFINSLQEYKGK